MKKLIYILFIILLSNNIYSANVVDVLIGSSLSKKNVGKEDNRFKLGYNFKLNMNRYFANNFGILTGLNYINKGYSYELRDQVFSNPTTLYVFVNHNYFEIPLFLVTKLSRFEIGLGGTFGYLLYARFFEPDIKSDGSFGELEPYFITNDLNKFDISLSALAKYEFKIKKLPFLLNLGYDYGLLDVSKNEFYKHRHLYFSIGTRIYI